MAEFPALPLWTDAYMADTRHLSTVEHGAYLLLLMTAWRRPHCDLPADDRLLARFAGLPDTEWEDVRDTVMALWNYDGRKRIWTQKRLKKERDYVAKRSALQRDRIAKRWNKGENEDTVELPKRRSGNTPTPTPTPTPKVDSQANACVGSGTGKKVGGEPEPKPKRPRKARPEDFVELWNELAERIGRPRVATLTGTRRQTLSARLAQFTVAQFQSVFAKTEASDFLAGRTQRWSGVTFDWLIQQKNFIKVLEGNYD